MARSRATQCITPADLASLRLANHRLTTHATLSPSDVVVAMGAIQAQDYRSALWAVGVRARGATLADVERALADAAIVRTWAMRGTLHLVPPRDRAVRAPRPGRLGGDRRGAART